jgi:hypothetical protein
MSHPHYAVLTEKGLRYVLANAENPEHIQHAKVELRRRGLKININIEQQHRLQRALDGYEKDR